MRFYDSEGNAVCSLHYKNKKCSSDYGDVYATLDVDQANVSDDLLTLFRIDYSLFQ